LVAPALRVILAMALCVALAAPASAEGLLDLFKFILPAHTFEKARTKTKRGYGAEVHGKLKVNGKNFDFVSGGRGRGSAPFGTYQVGPLGGFKTPKGTWVPGYRLSDAYDPFVNDTRTGLFIHPGNNASAGCVAIRKNQWSSFVKAIAGAAQIGSPLAIYLGPEGAPLEKPVS
jgi:hypothetical protein